MPPKKLQKKKTLETEVSTLPDCIPISTLGDIGSPPLGLRIIPMPYSIAFINVAKKTERKRSVHMVVDDPSKPFFKHLKLSKGDEIAIGTDRMFYCDPITASEAAMGIVGLICSGNPPDVPRQLIPGVTLHSFRTSIQTNLVIVPESSFDHWQDCFRNSFLAVRYVRTVNNLAIFNEGIPTCNVILLSSKLWMAFNKIFKKKNIRWARIVIEEHEGNPIDKQAFDAQAEFYWHLAIDPARWIKRPECVNRFREVGFYEENVINPAFFYIRNNPALIAKCHEAKLKRHRYGGSEDFLRKAGVMILQHSLNQQMYTDQVNRCDAILRSKHADLLVKLNYSIHHRFCSIRLEMASMIAKEIAEHASPEIIDMIIRQGDSALRKLSIVQDEDLKILTKDLHDSIIELGTNYLTESQELQENNWSKLQSLVDEVYSNQNHTSYRRDYYLLFQTSKTPFTNQELTEMKNNLPKDYSLVYGQVNASEMFSPDEKFEDPYLAIGIAPGVFISAILESGKPYKAVLFPESLGEPESDFIKSYYENAYAPSNVILRIGKLCIETGSTFILFHNTPCLVDYNNAIVQGNIYSGTDIVLF
jgi:hypothetical protein